MRFLRLDLLAFGPFTNVSLPLDEGDFGLHLVYGANEAGKSSALRALTQFLYGIPNQSKDNFVHANPNLRIGGELLDGQRRPLACIRRKGRTKTLRAADDTAEADMRRLAEMLAGVDEHAFVQRFGISYANLVAGGEAIALGKGDLSEVLFAAASGNARIKLLQQTLDAEAGELFKPTGQKPTINKTLSELRDAKSAIRERQLTTAEWKRNEAELAEARERLADVKRRLEEAQSELAKLRRIQEALPLTARRAGCLAELQQVAEAPSLPPDFTDRRLNAVSKLNADEATGRELQATLDRLDRELVAMSAPDELLKLADRLDQLGSDRATTDKAYVQDRPTLLRDLERLEQEANQIARDLGHDPDSSDLDSWRLSKTERARIDELKVAENGLRTQSEVANKAEARLQRELAAIESRLAELPPQVDGTRLRQVLSAARKFGDLDEQLTQKQAERDKEQASADKELKRLGLWNGTLDELESLAVPSLETIARCEDALDRAARSVEKIREEATELETRQTKLLQEIERLQQQQAVPTEADLASARQMRETVWQLIRRAWLDGESIEVEQRELLQTSKSTDLAAGYEATVAKADEVADRLRREARQVERLAQLLADEQHGALQADTIQRRLAHSDGELAQAKSEWRSVWAAMGIEPQSPREMRTWLARHESLLLKAASLRGLAHDAAQLREKIDVQRHLLETTLSEFASAPGCELTTRTSQPASLEQLISYGDAVLQALDDGAQERKQLERDQARLRSDFASAADDAKQARQQMDDWREQWQAAIVPLRLPRDATPVQATAVLDSLDDLASKRREAGSLRNRIRDIAADAERFLNAVRNVATEVNAAEAETITSVEDALAAVRRLSERLRVARETQSRLVALREQQKIESERLDELNQRRKQLEALLATLCREAGAATADDLPRIEGESRRRQELERELRDFDDRLRGLSKGASLDEFLRETTNYDADQLPARIGALESEIRELDEQRGQLHEISAVHAERQKAMNGASHAAEAREQQELLLGKLRADVDEYARLRLAGVALRAAMERYRERHQGPVLERASELFASLTCGSFAGLKADYNDKGDPVLRGVRPNGDVIDVAGSDRGMSEGTCDQLYLSLRLASLELWLADHAPIPFVVDDILVNFDDARATAALRVLGELSHRTQVILFTHHQHLVELARAELAPNVLFVHELGERSMMASS